MKTQNRISLVSLLLMLSALQPASVIATTQPTSLSVDDRLSRLTAVVRERQTQLPNPLPDDLRIAIGWGDGNGRDWVNGRRGRGWGDGKDGRDWVDGRGRGFADGDNRGFADTRHGGWADGNGRDWGNINPWRNGWADGGGFYNW